MYSLAQQLGKEALTTLNISLLNDDLVVIENVCRENIIPLHYT